MNLAQLKILQEVITLAVFYMGQAVKLNYWYAGICLVGAVYFIFKA